MNARRPPTSLVFGSAGFSLVELLIGLAAGSVVMAATIQTLAHLERRFAGQQEAMVQHQDLRIGLGVLEAELRLAGSGSAPSAAALTKSTPDEVEFLANLSGLVTVLTIAASAGERDLAVRSGADWPKGKRVLVCDQTRCEDSRLARDGRSTRLSLATPLGAAFPAGAVVYVSNTVRYYLRPEAAGLSQVMRQVDGGAGALIGSVSRFRLTYLGAEGQPTADPRRVSRIAVELAVGRDPQPITSLVGLSARRTV
ncbi:MAG: prepilin-type N-terminal cleavage/methylation domain-containing protein [Nitrospirae bacterium]|nr:prepilin-type N-terminal cleavage/methylation domain-containing protein [Nitrospirota bacterium]